MTHSEDAGQETPATITAEEAADHVLSALEAEDSLDWLYIRPPKALRDATGIGDPLAAGLAVVSAHWDGVAAMMGVSGVGYESVLRLLERLDREVTEVTLAITKALETEAYVRDVARIIAREGLMDRDSNDRTEREDAVVHGLDRTLKESLGWPELAPTVNTLPLERRWETMASGSPPAPRYKIVLIHEGEDEEDLAPGATTFAVTATWHEALASLNEVILNARDRFYRSDRERLTAFRRDVVNGVVRTFELTGRVGPYASYVDEVGPPSIDDLRIACTAHDELESGVPLGSKTAVVEHVHQLLRERGEAISDRGVREALERVGAYRKTEPRTVGGESRRGARGKQDSAGQVADLIHLRETVRDLCPDWVKVALSASGSDGSVGE